MRALLLLLLTGGPTLLVRAQALVTVSGTVRDEDSGETLPGATVRVLERPGVGTGVEANGAFTLRLPAGTYTLEASFLGYGAASRQVVLTRNQRVAFRLVRSEASLAEVVVTARRRDATISKAQAGVETLDMRQLARVPVLFGEKDILKTLTLLPGVKTAGEGTTGFSVRGGNLDQNLVLLDDAVIYNPSHLLGFFSAFNADALRDLTIYKGGMPAQYGGRLSSVVDVQTRDGDRQQLRGSGGIGLIASRLALEGPIVPGKGSFLLAARRTYADAFLRLAPDETARNVVLYFYDLNAKASYALGPRDRLTFSGYQGRDALVLPIFGQRYGNRAGTLQLSHAYSDRLTSNTALVHSKYDLRLTVQANEQDFNIRSKIRSWQLKHDVDWVPRAGQRLRAGLSAAHYVLTPGYVTAAAAPVNATAARPADALETAAYVSHEWAATDRLDFTLGLRATNFRLLGPGTYATYDAAGNQLSRQAYARGQAVATYSNLEPRLAASYQLAPTTTLKAGYARNVQNLHLLSNSLASSPTDLYVPTSRNVRPELADQLSAGYFRTLGAQRDYSVSAEVYYKWLQRQIDYRDGSQLLVGQDVESTLLFGRGRAYGLELLLRKDTGRLTGWVGYTLSKSERQFAGLNAGAWFNARQDRPHELSVVAVHQLTPRWSLSGTFVASTGNAVTYPVGKTFVAGQTVSVYGPRNADRLPAYRRLDVGATYEKPRRTGRRFHSSWNFSVYNALGRQNPFLITFETVPDDPTRTQAVSTALFRFVPSATYNFSF